MREDSEIEIMQKQTVLLLKERLTELQEREYMHHDCDMHCEILKRLISRTKKQYVLIDLVKFSDVC